MSAALRIETDPDTVARLPGHGRFAAVDRHPIMGGFGRRYYPAVAAGSQRDLAFAVMAGDEPLAYAPATTDGERLGFHGMPLRLFLADGGDEAALARAADAAVAHLAALVATAAPGGFTLEAEASRVLDAVGEACLRHGCTAALKLRAAVDLTLGEEARRAALRRSSRALVNWGRRTIALRYVNRAAPDRSAFSSYREFHRRVAGRVTRPDASWEAMFDWIAAGGGELALGHLEDGTLVSATLVVDGTEAAYYASGVYDRERFDKPMAHWPLWDAIGRARERGMAMVDLGEVPLPGSTTEKEAAIGYFKRGFATALTTAIVWTSSAKAAPHDA
jgi:hypothetical protein